MNKGLTMNKTWKIFLIVVWAINTLVYGLNVVYDLNIPYKIIGFMLFLTCYYILHDSLALEVTE